MQNMVFATLFSWNVKASRGDSCVILHAIDPSSSLRYSDRCERFPCPVPLPRPPTLIHILYRTSLTSGFAPQECSVQFTQNSHDIPAYYVLVK